MSKNSERRLKPDYAATAVGLDQFEAELYDPKEAFLKDARSYLRALAKELGWHGDAKINRGGIAVAGEAYARLFHPVAAVGAWVTIDGRGGFYNYYSKGPLPQGVDIIWRTTKRHHSVSHDGSNCWESGSISVGELAEKIRTTVAKVEPIVDLSKGLPEEIAEQHLVLLPDRNIDLHKRTFSLSKEEEMRGYPYTLKSLRSWSVNDLNLEREALMAVWADIKGNEMLRAYLRLIDAVLMEKQLLHASPIDNVPELEKSDEAKTAETYLRAMIALIRVTQQDRMNDRKFEKVWKKFVVRLASEQWIENCTDLVLIEIILNFYANSINKKYVAPIPGEIVNRFQNQAKKISKALNTTK